MVLLALEDHDQVCAALSLSNFYSPRGSSWENLQQRFHHLEKSFPYDAAFAVVKLSQKATIGTRWFSVSETKIISVPNCSFFLDFIFLPHVYPQGWRMILMTHSRSLWSLIYISLNNKSILPCSLYAGSNVAVIRPTSSHPLGNQSFFSFFLDFIFLITFILDLPLSLARDFRDAFTVVNKDKDQK